MKLSIYNIVIPYNNYFVIFNTYRNMYIILSRDAYWNVFEDFKRDLISAKCGSILHKLYHGGVIVDDDFDEYQYLLQEHKKEIYNSSTYNLTLLPSLDCNLRCWYCYEKHIKGSHLNLDIQKRVLKHVENLFEENSALKYLDVEMYGGEPLLYFESELYPLLKEVKEYVARIHKKVSFFFITNGVCINETNIDKFADLNASFQISIDGYKTTHDKVKILKGQGGTYDHVMKVVHLITQQKNFMFINLRVNYDDNTLEHLPEVIKDLQDIDRKKIRIHLERIWQTASKGKESADKLKKGN